MCWLWGENQTPKNHWENLQNSETLSSVYIFRVQTLLSGALDQCFQLKSSPRHDEGSNRTIPGRVLKPTQSELTPLCPTHTHTLFQPPCTAAQPCRKWVLMKGRSTSSPAWPTFWVLCLLYWCWSPLRYTAAEMNASGWYTLPPPQFTPLSNADA